MRPRILASFGADTRNLTLDRQSSHHLARVLRLRAGEELIVFNGMGQEARAQIRRLDPTGVVIELIEASQINRESAVRITVMQSLCTADKMDWVIEKCCELGVDRIIPIAARRSVTKLSADRAEKRLDHWRRIAQSASAQCGRNTVARIDAVAGLAEALNRWKQEPGPKTGWLVDPFAGQSLGSAAFSGAVTVMIGPEAGWSDDEKALAQAAGFEGIQCGKRILRTETAACVVVASLLTRAGEF